MRRSAVGAGNERWSRIARIATATVAVRWALQRRGRDTPAGQPSCTYRRHQKGGPHESVTIKDPRPLVRTGERGLIVNADQHPEELVNEAAMTPMCPLAIGDPTSDGPDTTSTPACGPDGPTLIDGIRSFH